MRHMRVRRPLPMSALVLVAVLGASACGTAERVSTPAASDEVRVSCGGGGDSFPAAALDGPTGADRADTAEAEGLRQVMAKPMGIGSLPADGWRLLDRQDSTAVFGASEGGGHTIVTLQRDGDQWSYSRSAHACQRLLVAPPDGLVPAVWWPDPDRPYDSQSRVLHVLATDPSCASGQPTGDRLQPPTVRATGQAVVISFAAKPVIGSQLCPGHPPTAYQIDLGQPIGDRQLLDGGVWPPAEPEPQP